MVTPFAVSKHDDGAGTSRLEITGALDQDTSDGLVTLIQNAARQDGVTDLVVDLQHVTFLAAAGVRALLSGRDVAMDHRCAYRVINARDTVHAVLAFSGVVGALGAGRAAEAPAR